MTAKLTILTVSYGHRTLLLENVNLARSINDDFFGKVEWHVAENSPIGHPDRFEKNEAGLLVRPGGGESGKGISHHHGSSLNHLLRTTPLTGIVMILDPDLYLLGRNWVDRLVDHMCSARLDFFGVPWHPRHSENYRYFPAVHCFVFNADRVSADQLDFTPKLEVLEWKESSICRALMRIPAIGYRLARRSWDTGTRVAEAFSNHHRYRHEVVTPIHCPGANAVGPATHLLNSLLPDALCSTPKRANYASSQSFLDRGWTKRPLPENWECFVWDEMPFALHVRGSFGSEFRNKALERSALKDAIAEFSHCEAPTMIRGKSNEG